MPHDPVRVVDTGAWLEKAGMDPRSARADLATDPPIAADALFHCQQAVEKALKAFLTWHDRPFRKTHDLVELGGQCVALDPALDARLRNAALLTEYAWKFRYLGEAEDPAPGEAEQALQTARDVVKAIGERLPPEARPDLP